SRAKSLFYLEVIFFFSSRRRHTIFSRDWSSDVCSSDLPAAPARSCSGNHPCWTTSPGRTGPRCGGRPAPKPLASWPNWSSRTLRSEERRVGKEGSARRWQSDDREGITQRD